MTYHLRLAAVISLLALNSSLFAQTDSSKALPRAYVGLNGGLGFSPQTVFNSKSTSFWMDYVKPGLNINVTGGVPIFHFHKIVIGATGSFGYYGNSFDINKYMNVVISNGDTSAKYTQAGYGSFAQYSLLAGAYAASKIGKTTLSVKAVCGGEYLTLPNLAYSMNYPPPITSYSETFTYIYTSSLGFVFGGGIQVAYAITKNLSVSYSSDVLTARVPYNYIWYVSQGNNVSPHPSSATAGVLMCNAVLGLTYSFGH